MMSRASALGAVLALCACTNAGHFETAFPAGARYVAMGSSFAAGAGIGPLQPGSPERCSRTVNNYAALTASALHLRLTDVSCGGATTANVLSSWGELPAQIDAVDQATRLVTVTIGGNDVNYVGNLFMASCIEGEIVTAGAFKIPCIKAAAPDEAAYRKLQAGLTEIAAQVRRRAPGARLVFVQYLSLVPGKPCAASPMTPENAAMNREIGRRLAAITAEVAKESGATLLIMDKLSRRHKPCDADPWSNGMPRGFDLSHGAPWHPNAVGHRAIAAELTKRIGSS